MSTDTPTTAFDDAVARIRAGARVPDEARALYDALTDDERLFLLDGDTPFWAGMHGIFFEGYNLRRHPAWGRVQETYGEDPVLLGGMGAALVRGTTPHAMACVKHYALNSMENARFSVDVHIDEATFHEYFLPHFRQAVDAGAAAVMSAYNSVDGEWAGQNPMLLTTVLRDDWGFTGTVITDFIWGMRDGTVALRAGLDVEAPFREQR